jgi:hypothetical protein
MASSHYATLLWRIALPTGLVALALFVLVITVSADSPPPASDNWTVDDETSIYGRDIIVQGNLTITARGDLTLRNLTLTMDCPMDRGSGIYIQERGKLMMDNVSVLSSDPDLHYWFEIHGVAEISGCDVQDVAANGRSPSNWNWIRGGVQLYNDDILLKDSVFHDSQRINAYVYGCSPTIINCTFSRAEYLHTYTRIGSDSELGTILGLFTDATGLFLVKADPSIDRCTFSHNGIPGSVLDLYYTHERNNAVATMGRGILAYESSPSISNCTFERNGEQPEDRVVDWTYQYFRDFVLGYRPVEGGLACIGADARPTVTGCTFVGNDAYGVFGDQGGLPTLLEGCLVRGTRAFWGSQFYPYTAGVFTFQGSGSMRISNTSMVNNSVGANINVYGTSLVLVNVTASHNVSELADNIILGPGTHEISLCRLESGADVLANIWIGHSPSDPPIVHINGSTIVGGRYAIRNAGYPYVYIRLIECKIWGQAEAAFLLWDAKVDCVDCDLPERIYPPSGYEYLRTVVNIFYYLEISVLWQNDAPIRGAYVQVENTTGAFLCGGISDANGTIGRQPVLSRSLFQYGGVVEVSHSPLRLETALRNITFPIQRHVFVGNSKATVTVQDPIWPFLHVLSPPDGHLQNSTTLEVKGVVVELESGLDSVEVSLDGTTWVEASTANMNWTLVLAVGEGVHIITVRATDMAGNEARATVANVTIDLTPPEIRIQVPEHQGALRNRTTAWIVGRTEPGTRVLIDQKHEIVDLKGTFMAQVYLTREGRNDFWVTIIDHAGNTNRTMATFTRDTRPPTILLDSIPDLTNETILEVSGTVTEVHLGSLTLNGVPLMNRTFHTTVALVEGANTITVIAIDVVGNSAVVEHVVTLDTVIPYAEMDSPTGDHTTSWTTLNVRGIVRGGFETITVNGHKVEASSGAFQRIVTLSEGLNLVTVNVTDAAGNHWNWTCKVTLDTHPPVITLEGDPDGTITNRDAIEIRGTVEGATVLMVGGEPVDPTGGFVHSVALDETGPDGEPNFILIVASDGAGNVATTVVRVFKDTSAPILFLDALAPTTRDRYVLVTGRLENASDLASLTVNGAPLAVAANGTFRGLVTLDVGPNTLLVRAIDHTGNKAVRVLMTERLPPTADDPADLWWWAIPLSLFVASLLVTIIIGQRGIFKNEEDRTRL